MNNRKQILLKIDHLHKNFSENNTETKVLEDISFQIKEGEIVSLVGPSGCGKSTLLHMIAGFDREYQGDILFDNQAVRSPSIKRSMVFQSPQLFPWLKVKDNIAFGLKRSGTDNDLLISQTNSYLSRIDMTEFGDFFPNQLSGGMQQRVALARALIMRPPLLLMDEPFSALDYQSRLEMQKLLLTLWEEYQPSILFVTHDIEEAILLADRIIVLSKRPGKIIKEIPVLFPRPREISLITKGEFHQIKAETLDALAVF